MLHRFGRLIGMGIALYSLVLPLLRVCVRGLVRFEGPRACQEPVGGAVLRRLRAFLLALIVAASVVPLVGPPVHAAPPAGSLDPTFGNGGKVMNDIDDGVALSVAVQAPENRAAAPRAFEHRCDDGPIRAPIPVGQ
jgi:hypothetical protein